ncbi:MAG: methyltransferase domain-containing protein [Gemmatimonadaceae bacterium]
MRSRPDADARLLRSFAPHDVLSSLARLIGFRDWAYRRRAVELLGLARGDRVVELGCGTGRNFSLLERAVGPRGAVIAVDLSETMLARAHQRADRHGWSNVELVHCDMATYQYPATVDGILSTYALTILPEYDRVIERACGALRDGGRCVVLDQKVPTGPASWLVPLLDLLSRPLDYSGTIGERRLWESIGRHADHMRVEEFYGGFVYLAVGEMSAKGARCGQPARTTLSCGPRPRPDPSAAPQHNAVRQTGDPPTRAVPMITSAVPLLLVLVALVALAATGNLLSAAPLVIAAQLLAVALSIAARRAFRAGTFRVTAAPGSATIVRNGPYRFVRHPMYTAVLLIVWSAVLSHWSVLTGAIGVAVTIVLVLRVVAEERLLRAQFPEYAAYARTVKALIPWIL